MMILDSGLLFWATLNTSAKVKVQIRFIYIAS